MTFDFTQQPPKPATLAESHKLIERLWNFTRQTVQKLNCNSDNSSLPPSQELFKNNLAERNIRHFVWWRKKTFGTQSQRGNRFMQRMLMVMVTAKQVDKNFIQELCDQLKLNKAIWASQ